MFPVVILFEGFSTHDKNSFRVVVFRKLWTLKTVQHKSEEGIKNHWNPAGCGAGACQEGGADVQARVKFPYRAHGGRMEEK